jgi:ribonuclease G
MYNVDDAIAKIDGYVISISGGGRFVGEKKMIRIDEVKRTAAYASLISDNGAEQPPTAAPSRRGAPAEEPVGEAEVLDEPLEGETGASAASGERVQSNGSTGKRRRGRRGGRRRSRAKAPEGSGS